jgi:hypothetical protein
MRRTAAAFRCQGPKLALAGSGPDADAQLIAAAVAVADGRLLA